MKSNSDNTEAIANTSCFMKIIQNHYRTTPPRKGPAQISRERWLIPGLVKFNRWYCMPAAFIIQFCCGSLYSWSVFNQPIDLLIYGSPTNMAVVTFYIAIGLLGISGAIMGPWLERSGPRNASILGGFLFCMGNLITSIALYMEQIWLVYLGYGVIGGFGIGLCYISPISALLKFFPDHRGLASGIAVSGFGAGSIISAKLEILLIDTFKLPMTFAIMGMGYFLCIFISGLILRTPPPDFSPNDTSSTTYCDEKMAVVEEMRVIPMSSRIDSPPNLEANRPECKEWTLLEALSSADFGLMYVMFFSNILFGLVAISRLSNMVTDVFGKSPEFASTVVAINGGFNLFGRLFFSLLSDYIGRKNVYFLMLTSQLIILIGFYFITTTRTFWVFLIVMWVIASCYGGGFGSIPAFLTEKFGTQNVGTCHGIILTGWSAAGLFGGIVFTTVFKMASYHRPISDPFPYNVNVWWMLGIVAIGWGALFFIQPTERDTKIQNVIKVKLGLN